MTPALAPPRCENRLATHRFPGFRTALAALILWPALASGPLSAAESAILSVGPASREQQRPADATRTAGVEKGVRNLLCKAPCGPFRQKVPDTFFDIAPVILTVDLQEELNDLQWAFETGERVAQVPEPADDPIPDDSIIDEQVPVGELKRDPCYVSGPITDVTTNIAPTAGKLPENVALECKDQIASTADPRMTGGWAGFDKHWAATGFCHQPLYFQEINAERYGYTVGWCAQPFVSAGRFLVTIPALPYLMVAQPPCECVYSLGYGRPGSCVPWRSHRPGWRLGAGATQAAVVVGLVFLIP